MTSADFTIGVICTANVCRSPFAAAWLERRLSEHAGIFVTSAGISETEIKQPPLPLRTLAAKMGIELSEHSPNLVTDTAIDQFDLVLTMGHAHRRTIVRQLPRAVRRTFTLVEFARVTEALSETDLHDARPGSVEGHAPDRTSARELLTAAIELASARRGFIPRPSDVSELEIPDPFGKNDQAYRRAVEQMTAAGEMTAAFIDRVLQH